MRDALDAIAVYTRPGRDAFFASAMMRDAVVRNLEIVGEAVKRLPSEITATEPEIPWRRITGMRDVLVHDYFGVDFEAVWNAVENEAPRLRAAIERLLTTTP